MAYAAVISLKNTIQRLLNSSRISIVSSGREMLESAYRDVQSLQQVLKRLDENRNRRERMKALEGQIIEAVYKLEDVLDSHEADQLLSQSKSHGDEGCSSRLSLDLQELRQDIDCFGRTAKKMEVEYVEELYKPVTEEEEDDDDDDDDDDDGGGGNAAVSSSMETGGNKSEMVGLTNQFCEIRGKLLQEVPQFPYMSIVGMAGVGKTALAKKIFEDPLIVSDFDCRAFVRVGLKYSAKKVQRAILAQVNRDSNEMPMEGDEQLDGCIRKSLNDKRYLIVLDDVWDSNLWKTIRRFPNEYNGSWILVTTRLRQVAEFLSFFPYNIRFLDKEESWDLLRKKVFDEKVWPYNPQIEKAGKKIAENCEGLPLLILTVADLLSKAETTLEYWTKVAEDKQNSIFMNAYDQISEVIYSSYEHLPQHLKACFLYFGVFPQNSDVRNSKLINLWTAEGFLESYPYESLEISAMECLKELVASNLVVIRQWNLNGNRAKACGLHSVFWNLCKREVENNKFLHILNSYADGLAKGIEGHRRLSIYKNILFSIKDVYNSMASISAARSLLCTGACHQYQVPIYFGLRLLKVLNALTIRLYEFPVEVLKLVQLRYLALTYNGDIPPSISKLWNLQNLVILQHMSIKSTVDKSYLPVEIWCLQELKYLQIMGRNLPDPCGGILPNLLTLLDVGAHSCTKGVLGRIPNLKKLRVQIELVTDSAEALTYFNRISHLYELTSLQCVIMNPKLSYFGPLATPPLSDFTFRLKKLTLSGFGYLWKDMSKIAKLPFLQVLKLQCFAFRGEKWEAKGKGFLELKCLLIEDTDLVQWTVGHETFPVLNHLTVKNCYKLQQIPEISSIREIRLVDCSPSVVTCAKQMENSFYNVINVYIHSSWDDGNLKP